MSVDSFVIFLLVKQQKKKHLLAFVLKRKKRKCKQQLVIALDGEMSLFQTAQLWNIRPYDTNLFQGLIFLYIYINKRATQTLEKHPPGT